MADSFGPSDIPVRMPNSYQFDTGSRKSRADLMNMAKELAQDGKNAAQRILADVRNYHSPRPESLGVTVPSKGKADIVPLTYPRPVV